MQVESIVNIFEYLYGFLVPTSRTLALISIIVGAILWVFGSPNTGRARRGQGMFTGGIVAFIFISAINIVSQTLASIIGGGRGTGADSVFPVAASGTETAAALTPLAAALSEATSILGSGLLAFGAALWATSRPGSKYRARSKRVFWWGIGLILASFIGILLTALSVLGYF